MSTANKLTYLGTTKGLIADSINNLGGSITSETTFREYAEELDTIYSNIPKATGEGTEVSLNTIKGKMSIIEKGNTEQDTTNGYNLLNPNTALSISGTLTTTYLENTRYRIQGLATGNKVVFLNMGIASGTYTLSITLISGSYSGGNLVIQDTSNTTIGEVGIGALNTKVTKTVTGTIGRLILWNTQTFDAQFNIQIETGSTAHSYEKYTGGIPAPNPQYNMPIKSVTGNNNVVVRGKNLYNFSGIVDTAVNGMTFTTYSKDKLVLSGNGNSWNNGTIILQLNKNTDYTISATLEEKLYSHITGFSVYGNSTASVSGTTLISANNTNTATVGTPLNLRLPFNSGNYEYILIRFWGNASGNNLGQNVELEVTNIQIEVGSTATSYEPYHTPISKPLNLGNIELNKIGTYEDVLFKTSGKNLFGGSLYNGQVGQEGGWSSQTTRVTNISGDNVLSNLFLKKGTYTISANGLDYCTLLTKNESGTEILDNYATQWNAIPFTFTLTQDGYLSFTMRNASATAIGTNWNVMLNLGSTALPYEPYGVGDWYNLEKLYNVTLASNFTITKVTNTTYSENILRFNIVLPAPNKKKASNANIADLLYCNMFTAKALDVLENRNTECIAGHTETQNMIIIFIDKNRLTAETVEAFQTYLSNNNIIVYYVKETPTYTKITNSTLINQLEEIDKLQSYNGTTIITSTYEEGNSQMILQASGLKGE